MVGPRFACAPCSALVPARSDHRLVALSRGGAFDHLCPIGLKAEDLGGPGVRGALRPSSLASWRRAHLRAHPVRRARLPLPVRAARSRPAQARPAQPSRSRSRGTSGACSTRSTRVRPSTRRRRSSCVLAPTWRRGLRHAFSDRILGRTCHRSESTLLRAFQRELDTTPITYLRHRRPGRGRAPPRVRPLQRERGGVACGIHEPAGFHRGLPEALRRAAFAATLGHPRQRVPPQGTPNVRRLRKSL